MGGERATVVWRLPLKVEPGPMMIVTPLLLPLLLPPGLGLQFGEKGIRLEGLGSLLLVTMRLEGVLPRLLRLGAGVPFSVGAQLEH